MTVREFESEFRRLYVPLGMYALRLLGDVDTAEDMVQDSFMKVWQSVERGERIEAFSAFMYRTVRNTCLSYLRTRQEMLGDEFIPEVTDEDIDTSIRDARIWEAIDALPDRCREVFLMSKRDGLSQEEIAEELGISVKTVKNQMTKAFAKLREVLTGHHKPFFLPFL
ncbi:MAG: RNA polymerase sigma-70 factor [Bacteroidales bacterium]|nr:RNA polymerase sigma-70 factor [Bacteroidales bacterium]MBD5220638.1 RNA polymerase sigma-70 factor [Bacteroidales bacterium]